MKFAAWNLTAVGGALLLATGMLRAATPNTLPEPNTNANTWRQTGPALGYWADYQPEGPQPHLANHMADEGTFYPYDPHIDEPNAFPYSSGQWWRNGGWYTAVDFVVWHRTRPFEKILGLDASLVGLEFDEELNKRGTPLGVEPGARATMGYVLDRDLDNRDHSLEFTYLGFNNWETVDGLVSETPRNLRVPEAPNYGGFNFSDIYSTFYRSTFHSVELNYRLRNRPGRDRMIMGPDGFWSRQLNPGCTQSLLVGIRGLSIEERWQWLSLRDGVSPNTFSGDYLVNTDNKLLGAQIGGDFVSVRENWFWGVRGTAGVYVNISDGFARIAVIDAQDPEPLVQNTASSETSAFFGELSFMLGWNVSDHILAKASYDLALAGGLVLAPDQVSFDTYLADTNPHTNDGGQIFYNGLSVGIEAYW